MSARWRAVAVPLALAGCASVPPPAAPPSAPAEPAAAPAVTPQASAKPPTLKKETLALLTRRGLTPISGQPITVAARCSFRDETGYAGQLELDVSDAYVAHLTALVEVPRQGRCRFQLAAFRQTQRLPIIELAAKQSPCIISLWQQGEQVTVAFRHCRQECEGNAVDYLWPILVDRQKGRCS